MFKFEVILTIEDYPGSPVQLRSFLILAKLVEVDEAELVVAVAAAMAAAAASAAAGKGWAGFEPVTLSGRALSSGSGTGAGRGWTGGCGWGTSGRLGEDNASMAASILGVPGRHLRFGLTDRILPGTSSFTPAVP